jgi:hypothetical protein
VVGLRAGTAPTDYFRAGLLLPLANNYFGFDFLLSRRRKCNAMCTCCRRDGPFSLINLSGVAFISNVLLTWIVLYLNKPKETEEEVDQSVCSIRCISHIFRIDL